MYQDGNFQTALQDGAKTTMLPLQQDGEYYATRTERRYLEVAGYYNPILYQRTFFPNTVIYSDDLTQAGSWTATNLTISTGFTDPEGNTTLCKVKENTTNGAHRVSQAITIPAGTVTLGAMVEAAERTILRLRVNNGTDNDLAIAVFDLAAVAVASGTGTIKKLLNGFFWVTVSGTATVANSTVFLELGSNSATFSYAGTTGSGLYLWHITATTAAAAGPAIQTTAATRGITCPAVDPDDPIAFLTTENSPDEGLLNVGMAKWSRSYCRIPRETNVPGSVIVSKPDIPRTGSTIAAYLPQGTAAWLAGQNYVGPVYLLTLAGVLAFERNINLPQWELYRTVAVTGDSGPSSSSSVTAGTYTLTVNGQTTGSLNYNDVAATVQTAINALSRVTALGGVVVTGSYTGGFVVTYNSIALATFGIGSLTGAVSSYPVYRGFGQQVTIHATAGTYTITVLGQTTASINYNDPTGTISTRLNALSNVVAAGGVTVSGGGFNALNNTGYFNIAFSAPQITGTTTSLQPAGSVIGSRSPTGQGSFALGGGSIQNVNLYGAGQRVLTVPAHGFTTADTLVMAGTSVALSQVPIYAFFDITSFTVVDANTISVTVTGQDYFINTPLITHLGAQRVTGYQPGPINCRCQVITDYFLPGVSAGITTAQDVTLATVQSDPAQFLGGMVLSTTLNYDVGDLRTWDGPILSATKRVVSVKDLGVTTVNLS